MRLEVEVDVATEFGTQLQGALNGKLHYARLCELVAGLSAGELVILNFAGVDVVTGSWISAMIVPLYRRASDPEFDLFFVLCSLSPESIDEFRLLAQWNYQCYLVATSCEAPIVGARLIGQLDEAQLETLSQVMNHRSVTGAELERGNRHRNIGATAWNNRLRDLFDKRLVRRTKRGREQVYSPIVEAIATDG